MAKQCKFIPNARLDGHVCYLDIQVDSRKVRLEVEAHNSIDDEARQELVSKDPILRQMAMAVVQGEGEVGVLCDYLSEHGLLSGQPPLLSCHSYLQMSSADEQWIIRAEGTAAGARFLREHRRRDKRFKGSPGGASRDYLDSVPLRMVVPVACQGCQQVFRGASLGRGVRPPRSKEDPNLCEDCWNALVRRGLIPLEDQ